MKIDRRQPLTPKEVEARKALVQKHMCDLIKWVGRGGNYHDPNEWIDSIVERRQGAIKPDQKPTACRRGKGVRWALA